LTALDLLAFLGDEALVPRIRDLAENHPDPTVRADARDKVDFLSD